MAKKKVKLTDEEKIRKKAYKKAVRKRKRKIRWENTKLRTSLFRIWFLKNIALFVQITVMTLVIWAILGGPDVLKIRDSIGSDDGSIFDIFLSISSVVISLLFGVGMISKKLRHISLADIRSVKTKKALIAAGLYFNEDGKLVKRVEEMIQKDIDGDGKVGDIELKEIPEEGILQGMKRAAEELGIVFAAKVDEELIPKEEVIVQEEKKQSSEPAKELTLEEKRALARERLRNRR